MTHTQEEIMTALKIIKDVCDDHSCSTCPFEDSYNQDMCRISASDPTEWELNTEEVKWYAFAN